MSGSNSDFQDMLEMQQARAVMPAPDPGASQPAPAAVSLPAAPPPSPWSVTRGVPDDSTSAPITLAPAAPPAAAAQHGVVHDLADQAWTSALQMGEGAVGFVDYLSRQVGADPQTSQWIEQQRRSLAGHVAATVQDMSPQAQQAMHASIFGDGKDVPTPGQVGWGNYLGATVASLVPQVGLALLPGGIWGKALSAASFGAIDAGEFYNQLRDTVAKAKPDELGPAYQALRQQGVPDAQAREQLIAQVAPVPVAMRFAVGAAAGSGVGSLLRGGAGAAAGGLARRAAVGAAEGSLVMGGQGAADEAVQQYADKQTGTRQAFDPSAMARAYVSGALGGALMGAGGGALHGGSAEAAPAPAPAAHDLPPDQATALQTALAEPGQPELPLTQAPPGINTGAEQGELFRTTAEANQRAAAPATPAAAGPTAAPSGQTAPAPQSAQPSPSEGMKRQDLVDALTTMPGQDPKALRRMALNDLRQRFDQLSTQRPGTTTVVNAAPGTAEPAAPAGVAAPAPAQPATPTTPEPLPDIQAQLAALADPNSTRDAVWVAKGTPMPADIPSGVQRVVRKEGTLLTTNAAKAKAFRTGAVTDEKLAQALGFPETKQQVVASGNPQAVQAIDQQGNVAAEMAASPAGVPAAVETAKAQAPGAAVQVTSPEAVIARREAATPVDHAAAQAAEPTPAQAEAGNYQKGHTRVGGLDVSIETPKGGVRRGVGANGEPWEAPMPAHYGYVRGTKGNDGDHVDITLGPHADQAEQHPAYVIDQIDPQERTFDEHKTFAGFPDAQAALAAYDGSFSDASGPSRRGAITQMPFDEFKKWLDEGNTKKPLAWKPTVGDQLRARRAAEKARMAETGARMKGTVATVEAPADFVPKLATTDTPEPKPAPPGLAKLREARRDIRDTFVSDASRRGASPVDTSVDTAVENFDRGHEPGEGIAATSTNTELAPTTDRQRMAERLLDQVRSGDKTVQEAFHEYGVQGSGPGRKRRAGLENFKAFLEHELEQADDPERQEEARKLLEASQAADAAEEGAATGNTKRGLTQRASQLRVGEDYKSEIRDLLRQFEDPVGVATDAEAEDKEATRAALRAKMKARIQSRAMINPRDSRYSTIAGDPRINSFVQRSLVASREYNVPLTLHDALRGVIRDAGVRNELRPLQAYARRLLPLVRDIRILTPDQAVDEHLISHWDNFDYSTGRLLGQWMTRDENPDHDVIVLNPHDENNAGLVTTLLHEATHSVTARYLESLQEGSPDMRAMNLIRDEMRDQFDAYKDTLSPAERNLLEYALTNVHEMHTMLMTDPRVQAFAASRVASSMFRLEMEKLGYPNTGIRSVWRSFTDWVRRALGVQTPASVADYSLLDHILRPAQDVFDSAVKHNAKMLPADPELRANAEPVLSASTHALRMPRRQEAIDKIDPKGLNDRAVRFWLQGATTDGIIDWNRQRFTPSDRLELAGNPLDAFRKAQEAIARSAKTFHDDYADRVRDLAKRLSGPERGKLGQLMVDATLAEAKPAEGEGPAAIVARYDALSAAGKATYKAVRDYYAEVYQRTRDAELSSLLRTTMPDATDAQAKAFAAAARTKGALEAFMADPDHSAVAAAFGDQWEAHRALAKTLARVHSYGFVQGDYFPLRRFGDYVLRYGSDENGDLGVEFFDRRSEAEARRRELLKDGADNLSQVMSRRESHLRDMLPEHPVVNELNDAMRGRPELKEHAEDVRNLVSSILLEHASRSRAAMTRMRRKGVAGASADAPRVLAQEFVNTGARIGYLEHGAERLKALADARLVADDLGRHGAPGEQIRAAAVVNELEKRAAAGDNAQNFAQEIARKANVLGYSQSLMSFSHALTSSIEAHMNSTSLLGARFGAGRTGLALTKALADVSPRLLTTGVKNTLKAVGGELRAADWNLAHLARDRFIARGADRAGMTALFRRMEDAGLIDHTQTQEMRRIANPSDAARTAIGNAWQRFMDFNAAGAHAVDVMNKAAVAKAAYDLEFRRTGSRDAAADYAVETVRKVMPNYNLGNKPRIATSRGVLGAWGTPIMQFKNYGLHMYSVMANLLHTSLHGASRAERMEARKAFAGVLATHATMAGVLTLVADPLRYVGGAYDWASGASQPHDYQADVRRWIADTFGPELGEVISRGLPHMAGIDIHRRVGLGNLLEVPELKSFDKQGFEDLLATALLGASGEDAATMGGAITKIRQGDLMGGLQAAVPRVIRDPLKAMNLASQGVTNSKGQTVLPASKLSAGDVAAQAVGFQPARVSEFREGRFAVMQAMQEEKDQRNQLEQAWLQADPRERPSVMTQIQQFNAQHPGARITISQLLQQLVSHGRRAAQPGAYGLRVPRMEAARLRPVGSFANVGQ